MKKITTLFFIVLLGFQLSFAQTTLTTAVDFTATDVDGNSFNLFNTLAAGKYVVLDFLFTTCGPCQQCAPKLFGAFNNYGCNTPGAEIKFVSINRDDNNAVMHNWEATYMNPTGPYPIGISGTQGSASAGPQTFHSTYGIGAFPTMILIAPNHQIVEQDMWPITDASTFTTAYFQPHGLNPMPCVLGVESYNNPDDFISIAPVPVSNHLTIFSKDGAINEIKIVNLLGEVMISKSFGNNVKQDDMDVSELSNGIYFVEMTINENKLVSRKFIKTNSSN